MRPSEVGNGCNQHCRRDADEDFLVCTSRLAVAGSSTEAEGWSGTNDGSRRFVSRRFCRFIEEIVFGLVLDFRSLWFASRCRCACRAAGDGRTGDSRFRGTGRSSGLCRSRFRHSGVVESGRRRWLLSNGRWRFRHGGRCLGCRVCCRSRPRRRCSGFRSSRNLRRLWNRRSRLDRLRRKR